MTVPCFGKQGLAYFSGCQEFLASTGDYAAIILACQNEETTVADLTFLRRHARFSLHPILLATNRHLEALSDGYIVSAEIVQNTIQSIHSKLAKLDYSLLKDGKTRFLAYLFSRDVVELNSQKSWQHKHYYYYPLVDLFIEESENYAEWLYQLSEQNILVRKDFVNFYYICSLCHSAHIGFSEICPGCHSKHIQRCKFLHCFTCGNVAPEVEFIKNGNLVCQKCNAKLGHIGDEYDIPLESGICHACHQFYVDAELKCECFYCDREFVSEDLAKQVIYNYKLSELGKSYIYSHFLNNTQLRDTFNYIALNNFYALISWLLQLNARYDKEVFSVLGIKLSCESNAFESSQFSFVKNLHKIVSSTDVLTRVQNQLIWILLPKTDQAGLAAVVEKIRQFARHLGITQSVEIKYTRFCSVQQSTFPDSAELLLDKLAENFSCI